MPMAPSPAPWAPRSWPSRWRRPVAGDAPLPPRDPCAVHRSMIGNAAAAPPARPGSGVRHNAALSFGMDGAGMAIKQWAAGVTGAAFVAGGVYLYLDMGGHAAPESTFVLLDGSRQSMADLRGKVTLVNFWATNCSTCVAEMPALAATYDKYHTQG